MLVKLTQRRIDHCIDHIRAECPAGILGSFAFAQSFREGLRGVVHLGAASFEGFGNRKQHAFETWPVAGVVGRKVRAAEERLSVRR